jgi:hypothetical protein
MLAGALVVPVSGCDLLPESTPATPAPPTADEVLVGRVTASIREVREVAAAVPGGTRVAAVHDAHLEALGAPVPSASTSASPTGSPTPAPRKVAELARAERALETTLTEAAVRAEDGGLARLLASMAAGVAQQVALLPAGKAAR